MKSSGARVSKNNITSRGDYSKIETRKVTSKMGRK
jgi:hypothetical protein